jgi:hypothetical protein
MHCTILMIKAETLLKQVKHLKTNTFIFNRHSQTLYLLVQQTYSLAVIRLIGSLGNWCSTVFTCA